MAKYTVRLPDDLDARIVAEAARQGCSKTELWRKAMAVYLADAAHWSQAEYRLDRIERHVGLGPLDLSVRAADPDDEGEPVA